MSYYINVLEYLENAATNYPDKLAFVDEVEAITFRELRDFSKAVACSIINKTNGSLRRPVVVMVKNNVYDIVGFMSVLYSGNFYVPIDYKMPRARLEIILNKLNPLMILNQEEFESEYPSLYINEKINEDICEDKLIEIRNKIIDTDPVYTIFTSGSTGEPKGIVINNRAVIDLVEWLTDTFNFSNSEIFGNQTPFYFDASVKDIYLTLKNASTMYILPKKLFMFPVKLIEFLNENKVTTILWATSAMNLVANSKVFEVSKFSTINKVFFAGETMYAKVLNEWRKNLPDAMYVNLYGPTEITVDCSYYIVNREFLSDEFVPIGTSCRNMEIMLLDEELNETDFGEICVRGTGVSLGYYNDFNKTNEAFIQNPRNSFYRDIIYRTGDIARLNEYGELVFISRKDGQVKHMGNRIELGEIEVNVNAIDGISEAVCLFDNEKDKIVLFCSGNEISCPYIINKLSSKLPKYMLPNVIKIVNDMPYNRNGKIDRVKLKELYFNGESN